MNVDEIAAHNIEAQEQLFADIWVNRTKSVEEIASRLGISEAETVSAMSGKDLTLTELRLLALSAGLTVDYVVSGAEG